MTPISSRLIVAVEDAVESLRPSGWRSLADVQIGRHIYETLVRYDSEQRLVPGVAAVSPADGAGMAWRFVVPPGRVFHDGAPLDAAAVEWNLRSRILAVLGIVDRLDDITVEDSQTLVLRTKVPFAPLVDRLAAPQAALVSPRHNGREEAGSGSYRLASARRSDVILVRTGDGAPESAHFREIAFRPVRDGPAMWTALLSGEVDLIYECPYDQIRSAQTLGRPEGVVVHMRPSLSVNMLLMNTTRGPARSVAFRRWIRAAINRAELLERAHLSVGTVPRGPLSPASPFSAAYEWAGGVPDAPLLPCSGDMNVLVQGDYNAGTLALLERHLGAAGVAFCAVPVPFGTLMSRLFAGEFDAALMGAGGSADPDPLLFELFHSQGRCNFARLADDLLDHALEQARTTLEFSVRLQLYGEALARIEHLAPAVFLRHGASIVAHGPRVTDVVPHADNYLRLESALPTSRSGRTTSYRIDEPMSENQGEKNELRHFEG